MATEPTPASEDPNAPWYTLLTRYHWYVLIVAALGWLFDTMDQQIFILARGPALSELLDLPANHPDVASYAGWATTIFIMGWATGGLIFGLFGDRFGRVRTMIITILIYSIFTGLSALAQGWLDFAFYRFLCGVGVGGEFAAGITLVAEVMPARARPYALGLLQALSTVGNMMAAVISMVIPPQAMNVVGDWQGWRVMFLVGIFPAFLVIFIRRKLKEPETWQKAKQQSTDDLHKRMGDMREMFGDPTWRYHTIIGVLLAMAGVMGLWGIAFWTPELVRNQVLGGMSKGDQDWYAAVALFLQNFAGFFGIYSFSLLAGKFGRRPVFALAFLLAFCSIFLVFGFMTEPSQIFWMIPILGFSTYMIFGGLAIYFPELYPTRLRSTGTGFCYNVARYLAAVAPAMYGFLVAMYVAPPSPPSPPVAAGTVALAGSSHFGPIAATTQYAREQSESRFAKSQSHVTALSSLGSVDNAVRYAALTVAFVYIFGMMVLPFAPETKDKPLPE